MDKLIKITVTGPECSGKSWLCQRLAAHFNTTWAPEYARIYLEEHGPGYDFKLLARLEEGHLKHQQKYLAEARKMIFLDTDLINYLVWEKLAFGKQHPKLVSRADKETDHRYLITYPDLPWEDDPLRENPANRIHIYDRHLREVANRQRPYRVVKGQGEKRLENAIRATKELMRP